MRLEVLPDVFVQLEEPQGVPVAARHVVVRGLGRAAEATRHGDDRVHDVVDRDQVDDALGDTGELGDLAETVGADDRVGHLEPVDPSGRRVRQRRLDDARADDRQAQPSACARSSTARSPIAFVKVYTSGHPSVRARIRPYSISRASTQAFRRSSASVETVFGPARE